MMRGGEKEEEKCREEKRRQRLCFSFPQQSITKFLTNPNVLVLDRPQIW